MCHCLLPLLAIPLTFLLLPNSCLSDPMEPSLPLRNVTEPPHSISAELSPGGSRMTGSPICDASEQEKPVTTLYRSSEVAEREKQRRYGITDNCEGSFEITSTPRMQLNEPPVKSAFRRVLHSFFARVPLFRTASSTTHFPLKSPDRPLVHQSKAYAPLATQHGHVTGFFTSTPSTYPLRDNEDFSQDAINHHFYVLPPMVPANNQFAPPFLDSTSSEH